MKTVLISAVAGLEKDMSTRRACAVAGFSRATLDRFRHDRGTVRAVRQVGVQPSALSADERALIRAYATSDEFVDKSPHQVFYTLLERGVYVGSVSTWYRVLRENGLVGERREHVVHPPRVVPHLHACRPGQVASWDITAVKGPRRGVYFYAWVMVDLFSRMIPAALVHDRQVGAHTPAFIRACIQGFGGITPDVIHSDNGAPMIAGTITELYSKLGITRSLSRPRVSNDNPFSEAVFKTLKHAPAYPDFFTDRDDAQRYFDDFRAYYNTAHYHSGLNYYTPESVFNGTWKSVHQKRQETVSVAYQRHPERFRGVPVVPVPPTDVWINQPRATISTAAGGAMER